MKPGDALRAEAERSERLSRELAAAAQRETRPIQRDKLACLAAIHKARAPLFDRCAEAFERCGRDEWAEDNARADAALEAYLDLPAVRAEKERQRLLLEGTLRRSEREAPEMMARWLKAARAADAR